MKILKLSPYYEPEKIASSHLTKDLEETLVNEGFSIRVITPTPSRTVDRETRKRYRKIRYETKFNGKIEIIRFKLFKETNSSIFRAIRYFISIIKQYRLGKKQKDVDLIISGSTPPIQGILVSKLKKKLKVPMIYVLQDIFPDSLINTGLIKRKGLIWKIGRKIEDYTYKNADKIIVISDDFKKNIMKKGVSENKIQVIHNWINTENVKYIDRENNYIFEKYDIDKNKFIISYCGNLGHTQNLEMVLQVAKQLEEDKDIYFVIVGEGKNKKKLLEMKNKLELPNLIFLPFQPSKNISEVFSIADIGLVVSKPNIGNNSVPSKLFTMMAASQPIIASFDNKTTFCDILIKSQSGVCVEPNDEKALVQEIYNFKKNTTILKNYGINGKEYVRSYYSKESQTNLYLKTINCVIT